MSRNYFGYTPLEEAIRSGNLKLLENLVKHGAEVNASDIKGRTPLLLAATYGNIEVFEWLLAQGASLDVCDNENETVLLKLLWGGKYEYLEKLWPQIVEINHNNPLEKYPLVQSAAIAGSQNVRKAISFLLDKGVDIKAKDESGRTAFQRAAQGGDVEIARIILAKGASLNESDPEGSTPLHLAVKNGKLNMVNFLIENKAELNRKDNQGRTPIDLVEDYSYPEISKIFMASGAEKTKNKEAKTVASLLSKTMRDGESIIWSLGHCGYAVKTKSKLLIFDYHSYGSPPEKPSLANGYINLDEIKDLDIVVFVSHNHYASF